MSVRVVAPDLLPALEQFASAGELTAERREFREEDVAGARLGLAASNDAAVNEFVARVSREAGALVNIADNPEDSDFVTPAVHRTGPLVVAVTAGGVPGAAMRVRDLIAERIGGSYGEAVGSLGELRRSLLGSGQRNRWREAAASLLGADFQEAVESGSLIREVASWR